MISCGYGIPMSCHQYCAKCGKISSLSGICEEYYWLCPKCKAIKIVSGIPAKQIDCRDAKSGENILNNTMRIEDLRAGDKIKYNVPSWQFDYTTDRIRQSVITDIQEKNFILYGGLLLPKENIISKLESQKTYKEIPIEKPKSLKFEFVVQSTESNTDRYGSYPQVKMNGFGVVNGQVIHGLSLPFSNDFVNLTLGRNYTVEIKVEIKEKI